MLGGIAGKVADPGRLGRGPVSVAGGGSVADRPGAALIGLVSRESFVIR
jgi:hypothetical protein